MKYLENSVDGLEELDDKLFTDIQPYISLNVGEGSGDILIDIVNLKKQLGVVKKQKDVIYRNKIEYPLNKLVENIINRFKFPYYYDTTLNIQREVISFLISIFHKYKADKGKAFSYFSVVTKNYLILTNRAKHAHSKSHKSITVDDLSFDIIDNDELRKEADGEISEFITLMLQFWNSNINSIFKKRKDIMVAYAVLELFNRSGNIENFNKKALYIMIREMTGVKTQYITNVINKMKIYTTRMFYEYNENGIFDTMNTDIFFE